MVAQFATTVPTTRTKMMFLLPSYFLTGVVVYQSIGMIIVDGRVSFGEAWMDWGLRMIPLAVGSLTAVQHFSWLWDCKFYRNKKHESNSIVVDQLPLYSTEEDEESEDEKEDSNLVQLSDAPSATGSNEIRQFAYLSLFWFLTGILFVFVGLYHLLIDPTAQTGSGITEVIIGVISMVESTVCVVLVNCVGLGLEQGGDVDEEDDELLDV